MGEPGWVGSRTVPTTALITGGAGFIGCALEGRLRGRFDRVVAMDSLHPQVHSTRTQPAALHEGVERPGVGLGQGAAVGEAVVVGRQ